MSDSPTSSSPSLPHCREQRSRGEQEERGTGETTLHRCLMLELDVTEEGVNMGFFSQKAKDLFLIDTWPRGDTVPPL